MCLCVCYSNKNIPPFSVQKVQASKDCSNNDQDTDHYTSSFSSTFTIFIT
jgi:hypothetical protein